MSLSTWRAWIEINTAALVVLKYRVALYMESVDWNCWTVVSQSALTGRSLHGERGLKFRCGRRLLAYNMSLSTWRAWIEISLVRRSRCLYRVALYMESVDWNSLWQSCTPRPLMSLSTWRAWIEILNQRRLGCLPSGRSLHGERGLKFYICILTSRALMSLSTWRAWIEIKSLS